MRYATNEVVRCPGTQDRRAESRGDRRGEPRPCTQTFGRVTHLTEVYVRIQRPGVTAIPGTLVTPCSCGARVEIVTRAAAEAA